MSKSFVSSSARSRVLAAVVVIPQPTAYPDFGVDTLRGEPDRAAFPATRPVQREVPAKSPAYDTVALRARARKAATFVRLAHASEQNRRCALRDTSTYTHSQPAARHTPNRLVP
jgi:hypothetical protein